MVDLIRAPNHLGDFVLSLPALRAAPQADLLVREPLDTLAQLALPGRSIVRLGSGARGFVAGVAAIRRGKAASATLLTRSFSSALLVTLAGVRHRRGAVSDGRGALLTDPVSRADLDPLHRSAEYAYLVTGDALHPPPALSLAITEEARTHWRHLVPPTPASIIGVAPGSRARARAWEASRYALIVERLVDAGHRVVVFGSADEHSLTAQVAGPHAIDLGGRCTLPLLAAGLSVCDLLLTNDSGPMHLAAGVGTPTLSLWGAGDPARTRPLGAGHRILRHPELPCVPCVRNSCPRHGAGTILPEAERECMALIGVEEVWRALSDMLAGGTEPKRRAQS